LVLKKGLGKQLVRLLCPHWCSKPTHKCNSSGSKVCILCDKIATAVTHLGNKQELQQLLTVVIYYNLSPWFGKPSSGGATSV